MLSSILNSDWLTHGPYYPYPDHQWRHYAGVGTDARKKFGPWCEKNIWAPQSDNICRRVRCDSPPENF